MTGKSVQNNSKVSPPKLRRRNALLTIPTLQHDVNVLRNFFNDVAFQLIELVYGCSRADIKHTLQALLDCADHEAFLNILAKKEISISKKLLVALQDICEWRQQPFVKIIDCIASLLACCDENAALYQFLSHNGLLDKITDKSFFKNRKLLSKKDYAETTHDMIVVLLNGLLGHLKAGFKQIDGKNKQAKKRMFTEAVVIVKGAKKQHQILKHELDRHYLSRKAFQELEKLKEKIDDACVALAERELPQALQNGRGLSSDLDKLARVTPNDTRELRRFKFSHVKLNREITRFLTALKKQQTSAVIQQRLSLLKQQQDHCVEVLKHYYLHWAEVAPLASVDLTVKRATNSSRILSPIVTIVSLGITFGSGGALGLPALIFYITGQALLAPELMHQIRVVWHALQTHTLTKQDGRALLGLLGLVLLKSVGLEVLLQFYCQDIYEILENLNDLIELLGDAVKFTGESLKVAIEYFEQRGSALLGEVLSISDVSAESRQDLTKVAAGSTATITTQLQARPKITANIPQVLETRSANSYSQYIERAQKAAVESHRLSSVSLSNKSASIILGLKIDNRRCTFEPRTQPIIPKHQQRPCALQRKQVRLGGRQG